ncbi:O-methyltransferase [Methylotuvimicrobium sp. KM2]|uniref:O-methyltransferase n=1 Tax=Methylotuvimicrobium sp. KM2 TaxID=3133976 RepID=UPI003100F2CC
MSGRHVPYYLRPNKHVDRQIFIEILSYINRWIDLSKYLYISMGGKFLEDHKAIHSALSIKKLMSIECDQTTFERQRFNRPLSLIDCRKMDSGELIQKIDDILEEKEARNYIVWLDYASAKNRQGQIQEVETVASKMSANDVLKVTLNASIKTLGNKEDFDSTDDFQTHALKKAKNKLGRYFPGHTPQTSEMTDEGFARIISQAAKTAILNGLRGSRDLTFQPLGQFRYNDGFHSMFTLTGIILKRIEESEFIEKSGIEDFELTAKDWHVVSEIALPDLSLRERMAIDVDIYSSLPDEIHKRLPFKFDEDDERSLDILKRYIKHYKRYPNFVRAVL